LVTPEKIKEMKKIRCVLGLIVFAGLLFSCSGAKKAAESRVVQNAEIALKLSEEQEMKQKEFELLFVEALKQKMLGNTGTAVQYLARCLEIDPNSAAVMYELANIYADSNNLTNASLLLEKAVSINPANKWYKIMLAQTYQQQHKFEEASDIYSQLLENEPENHEYLFTRAVLLANAGLTNEAIEAYNALEKKVGIIGQISIEKQHIYTSMGDTEKAFAEIYRLIEANPYESQYYGILADLYLDYGDEQNALKYYNKILEMDPSDGFVHISLANYFINQGNFDLMFDEVKLGFESDGLEVQTKLQYYIMLISNRNEIDISDQRIEELSRILLEKHSGEYFVHSIFAETLLFSNKLAEAREQLIKAVEIEPNDYTSWERILYIDNDLHDWEGLYEYSKKTIELFPSQSQPYLLNALACLQLEKYDETISVVSENFDKINENKRIQSQFLMLKGEAVYKLNRHDEAFELFDNVIELFPENYVALNNYAYYLSLAGKNLEKAERMSAKVIEQFPDNSTYLDTYAWVFFKKGEYKLARFYMQSALNNGGSDNPVLLEHYGDILYKLEMKDDAKLYWERAKENGGDSEILLRKISEQRYIED